MNSVSERVTQIYNEHYRAVISFVRGGFPFDAATSEDVVADVFQYLHGRLQSGGLEIKPAIRGLLCHWARERAIDEVRRRKRQAQPWSGLSSSKQHAFHSLAAGNTDEPWMPLLDNEKSRRRRVAIEGAMRDLTRHYEATSQLHYKAVFELRVVLGWESPRISQRLSLTSAQVYRLTYETRSWLIQQLRRLYDSQGSLFASRYGRDDSAGTGNAGSQRGALTASPRGNEQHWHLDQQRLQAVIDGDLPEAESAKVQSHLARCADCRRAMEARNELDRRVRAELQMARSEFSALCPTPARLERFARCRVSDKQERDELTVHILDGGCTVCKSYLEVACAVSASQLAGLCSNV